MKQWWHDLTWSDNFGLYAMLTGLIVGTLVAIVLIYLVEAVFGVGFHPILWAVVGPVLMLGGQLIGAHIGLKLYLE